MYDSPIYIKLTKLNNRSLTLTDKIPRVYNTSVAFIYDATVITVLYWNFGQELCKKYLQLHQPFL